MPGDIRVRRGVVTPSVTVVRSVVKQLQSDIKTDRALAAQFKKNPQLVLGQRGLSADVQSELLREAGRRLPGSLAGKCDYTCICTGCSFTKNREFGVMINPAYRG